MKNRMIHGVVSAIITLSILVPMITIPSGIIQAAGPDISVGDRIAVTAYGDGVAVRSSYSTGSPLIRTMPAGYEGKVIDGPQYNEGYTWWYIQWVTGDYGWTADAYPGGVIYLQALPGNGIYPNVTNNGLSYRVCVLIDGDNLAVRTGPGSGYTLITRKSLGNRGWTTGDGPYVSTSEEMVWWYIEWDDGTAGWSADSQGYIGVYLFKQGSTPLPTPGDVSVATYSATSVGENQATLRGAITDFNNNSAGYIRFRYRPSGGSWSYTSWSYRTTTTTYSQTVYGLNPDTNYEFCAQGYGTEDTTTITGDTLTFHTASTPPGDVSVATYSATGIGENQATLQGAITNFNNNPSAEIRFRYRVQGTTTWSYTGWVTRTATTTYPETVTSLNPDTTYEFQAEGRGTVDTTIVRGDTLTFHTASTPPGDVSVATYSATSVGENQATLRGAITDFNNNSAGYIRFRYRPLGGSWSSTSWVYRTDTTTYLELVDGLDPGTIYEFYAQAYGSVDTTIDTGATLNFETGQSTPDRPLPPTNPHPGEITSPGPVLDSNTVTLQWDASFGATRYALGVVNCNTGTFAVNTWVYDTSYPVTLQSDTPYRWNVAAWNEAGYSDYTSLLYFQTPSGQVGPIVLTEPLQITPVGPYFVGNTLIATFTVKNAGDVAITLDKLLVGGRCDGWELPDGHFPDFNDQTVTLQPGQSHQYQGTFTIPQAGTYRFFVAYFIENPSEAEKQFLDDNNWNTCMDLSEGLTHTDRVENIMALVDPEIATELEEDITRELCRQILYPPYLLDANSFTTSVATLWAELTSWVTQTELTELYRQLYSTGIEYAGLRHYSLYNARSAIQKGDVFNANKYLEQSRMYERLMYNSFNGAFEAYDGALGAGEILAEGIKDGCQAAVKVGVKIVYPPAATWVDAVYSAIDFSITAKFEGIDQALIDLAIEQVAKYMLKNAEFDILGDYTLEDYVNQVTSGVRLDTLLADKEFMTEFGSVLRKVIIEKVVDELGIELSQTLIERAINCVINDLQYLARSLQVKVKSPVELGVLGPEEQITGLIDGTVRHGIPMSFYNDETVTVLLPTDSYQYRVIGIDGGTYGIDVDFSQSGETATFAGVDIPINIAELHLYTIDWDALADSQAGLTIEKDYNGDGEVDEIIITGIPETPANPSPLPNSANVRLDKVLSWTGNNSDSVTYNIYLGDNATDLQLVSERQAEKAYVPTLEPNTVYYWRVVAINEHNISSAGSVWVFATGEDGVPFCFIATAAYGTPMAEEIQTLRDFRDEYLLTNPLGQAFVKLYYRVSPPIAKFITDHPSLKPIARTALVPAVAMSTAVVNTTATEKAVTLGVLVLVSVAVAIWVTRRRGKGPEYT